MENKVIVSAIGYNSVFGNGVENYWSQFNNNAFNSNNTSIIEDVDPQKYLNSKGQKFINKASLIYCNVAFQCINQRKLKDYIEANPDRVGLYDSSELSNIEACFQFDLIAKNEGPDFVSPMNAPNTIANAAASQMAIQAGIKGPNFSICAGTVGSLHSLDIASLHLKQGITDYAIVGSTEVINIYQSAVRRGERRNPELDSSEQGAAVMLEKSDLNNQNNNLACIETFSSGTQIPGETKEGLIWRLIDEIKNTLSSTDEIDLCIVSGGGNCIKEADLTHTFKMNGFNAPLTFPERIIGFGDNAGGILGVLLAIGIFNGKIKSLQLIPDSKKQDYSTICNIIVISADSTGSASVVLISKTT